MIMKKALLVLGLCFASTSYADSGAPPVAAAIDAGAEAAGSAAAPSATLHDPTTDPAGALADVRSPVRWPLKALVILIGLAKLVPFAAGKFGPFGRWLAVGRRAMAVVAIGGLAMVAYDALSRGSSWMSAGLAVVLAAAAYMTPHAPEAKGA